MLHVCKHLKMAKRAIEACDSNISDNPQSPEVETSPGCSKRRKLAYCGAAKYPSKFKSEWNKAKIIDGYVDGRELFHYRVDILWLNIGHMVIPESSAK